MDSECPSQRSPEAVGLKEHRDKTADFNEASPHREVSKGIFTGHPSTHLKAHQGKLIAELRVNLIQLLRYPDQGLVEAKARLHRHHQEVQCIRERTSHLLLAVAKPSLQPEKGEHPPHQRTEGRSTGQGQGRYCHGRAQHQHNRSHTQGQKDAKSIVGGKGTSVTIPCLNQLEGNSLGPGADSGEGGSHAG
jgi:hypothetical protein